MHACMQDLEERLGRYQAKCDILQLKNDDLQKKLEQQIEERDALIDFLKCKNKQQADEFEILENKMSALQQAMDDQREKLEAHITQLKEDSQHALDQAAMENKVLQAQLESLDHFRQNKEKLEKEMQSKEEMIEQLKKENSETVYRLEKKAVLDKDRLVTLNNYSIIHG